MIKVHTYFIWEIQTSRIIQHVGIYCQNTLLLKEEVVQRSVFTRYSPIVAAATFVPKFFKILDPPFDFILPAIVWIPELCFSSTTNLEFLRLK